MLYRLLSAYTGACAYLIILLQFLSLFQQITFWPVLLGTLAGVAGIIWLSMPRPRAWSTLRTALQRRALPWRETASPRALVHPALPFVVVFLPLLVFLVLQGWRFPPNDFDAMTYHLSRAAYWRQWHSLAHYTTNDVMQIAYPGNVEVLFTVVLVLLHTARAAYLVPIGAYLMGTAAVYGISRQAGARRPYALFGAGLFATMPAVVIQSNSTMIDIPAASFLICAVYFFVDAVQTRRSVSFVWLGLALGLAVGAKPMTAFALPGLIAVGVFLVVPCAGSRPLGRARRAVACTLAARNWFRRPGRLLAGFGTLFAVLVLFAPWYVENYVDFGAFSGPARISTLQLIAHPSVVTLCVNLFRHLIAFIDPSGPAMIFQPAGDWLCAQVADLRTWLAAVTGAGTNVPIEFEYTSYSAAPAPYFVDGQTWFGFAGGLAVFAALAYALRTAIRPRASVAALCAAGAASSLLFTALFLDWQPWEGKYIIPMAALCCPVAAVIAGRLAGRRAGRWALFVLALYAAAGAPTAAAQNSNRPLAAWSSSYSVRRASFYPWMVQVQAAVDSLLPGNARVGVLFSDNRSSWEFPFFGDDLSRTLIPIKLPQSSGDTFPGAAAFAFAGPFTYLATDESDSLVGAFFAAKPALRCVQIGRDDDGYGGVFRFYRCASVTLHDLYRAALSAQNAGDFSGDLIQLDEIARTNPDYQDTLFARGWALWNLGQREAAITVYRAYLLHHADNAQAQLNLAYSLIELGRCGEAIAHLRLVLRLDPGNKFARQDLAVCGTR